MTPVRAQAECRRLPRAGVTLLEVMVAIAIVVAIGALSLPFVSGTMDANRFASASDELVGHLLLARSSAQERGDALEVICRHDGRQLCLKAVSPAGAGEGEDEGSAADVTPGTIVSCFTLPDGITLEPSPSADESGTEEDASANERVDGLASWSRVAVYGTDGSVMLASAFRLCDESGRTATLRFDPFTGMPSVGVRSAHVRTVAEDADEELEAEEESPAASEFEPEEEPLIREPLTDDLPEEDADEP